jgi:hypothetical protein
MQVRGAKAMLFPSARVKRRCMTALAALTVLALVVLTAPVVRAHALGQTRVTVTFTPDGTYTIDMLVDPESLLAKLEILSGQQQLSGPIPLDQLPARIGALQRVLLDNTHVVFDGAPDHPAFAYLPGQPAGAATTPTPSDAALSAAASSVSAPAASANADTTRREAATLLPAGTGTATGAPTATVRLTGRVPDGAKSFRFTYGLVLGAYPLTIAGQGQAAEARTVWLTGGQESDAFDLTNGYVPPSRVQVARQYLVLGFEHIVPKGVDHILFVLGIFLLSTAWRPILLQVTTFTIAHSITLGLTIYGLVSLPSSIVEPLIALSIMYVAIENLFTSSLRPWRLGLVFAFGLLHGMGFAGVLKELGLPRSEFLTALVTFNLGVEGGQLAVIAMALIAVGWWRRAEAPTYRRWIVVPASLLIAAVGAYWTVTRAIG